MTACSRTLQVLAAPDSSSKGAPLVPTMCIYENKNEALSAFWADYSELAANDWDCLPLFAKVEGKLFPSKTVRHQRSCCLSLHGKSVLRETPAGGAVAHVG